ncbi:MAG: FAD binding domain-containing protein, partial [Thermotogota bacterium]
AIDALAAAPGMEPIAGGTSLLVDLRGGRAKPETLLDLGRIDELRGISVDSHELVIGATTTIAEVLRSPAVAEHAPLLVQACATFASPLVRNRATIGGNLAYASPAADAAPPLLALDAVVELRSVRGRRQVALSDFFKGVRKTARKPDELLTSVHIPMAVPGTLSAYRKLGLRKADAISVVSAAVRVVVDMAGRCETARVALGAVAPIPLRAPKAETALIRHELTIELVVAAAKLAAEATSPIDDLRGTAAYRTQAVEALVKRALLELVEKGGEER